MEAAGEGADGPGHHPKIAAPRSRIVRKIGVASASAPTQLSSLREIVVFSWLVIFRVSSRRVRRGAVEA